KLNVAYEELGYALYRLKRFEESAEASKAAIRLQTDFMPFYNLGLVHVATGNWEGAKLAFRQAIDLREPWRDEYIQAYYFLGYSLVKVGEIQQVIQALEKDVELAPGFYINRFELANLYLWVGKQKAAKAQYEILNQNDPELAKELMKLMKRHAGRKPA